MTAPYAKAVVEAELRWGNVGTEFERRVRVAAEKAAKAAQKHFDRIKLAAKVDLNTDTGLFGRETQNKLDSLSLVADVTLRADTAQFHADVRRAIRNLPEANVNVTLDSGSIQTFVAGIEERLRAARITAPVFLEVANESEFRAYLAVLTRPVTQDVIIRTIGGGGGGGSADSVNRLDFSLGNVAKKSLKLAGIATLIGAIGGAAGIAAGAVGALVAGLGAVGLAGVAGLATTLVGMKGIGDAFSAFSAETESATADAEAQAKKVASARKGVEQANRGVEQANRGLESAEKTVARANKDSQRAQEDLSQAREDAVRQIEDLNFALKGTAIDERDAELALARAREAYDKTFADPAASALDRADAALGVDKALRRQEETMRRNADIEKDAREASEKGVEQSDQVVAAKEKVIDAADRVKDAEQGVADAQVGVADAQQAVVDAQADLQEAMDSTSSAADKTAQALAKLSPNARSFVLAMRELGPEWEAVRKSVQDNMFDGLDVTFSNLAQTSMPMLKEGMGQVGTSINGAAKEFAAFWGSAGAQDSMRNIFAGTADLITAMQPGLAALTTGILDIGNAAAPVMGQLGDSLGNLLGSIGEAFTEAFADGSLTELLGHFATMMDGLGGGLNALLGGLIDFGNIVGPILGPLLQTFGESIAMLAPSLGQLGLVFGEALIEILPTLSQFISSLADGLAPVMPIIADLLKSLGAALTPLIPPLSQILQTVGTALVGAIDALAPAIGPLGEAFASLIGALAPILPLVAEVIGMLVSALAPALTTIFEAFAPVIQQLVDQMKPVIEQMAPILAEVAMALGDAIVQALNALAPMLPTIIDSFSQIVLAIMPFIPQLIQIAAELLPKLIEVIAWLVENILPPLTQAIVWLAENVLPLVIEGIRQFAQMWGDKLTEAKDAMQRAKDFLSDRFEDVKSALTGLKDFFSNTVDAIGRIWDRIKELTKGPVAFVVNTIYNDGIAKAWNAVAGVIGLDDLKLNRIEGFQTGGIMSGYTPGRDDRVIAVGGGEAVMRPEWTRAVGADYVNGANAAARSGGVSAVQKFAGFYANGGIVESLTAAVKDKFPMMTMTSGLRYTDNGHHSTGHAADFSNGGDAGTPEMQTLARWIASNYKDRTLELIHSPFDQNIKNMNFVGDGMGTYGAGTMAGHRNHVHWAADGPVGPGGEPEKDENGNWFTRAISSVVSFVRDQASKLFEIPVRAIGSSIPDFGGAPFMQTPKRLYDKMADAAIDFVKGKAKDKDEASGSVSMGAIGGNAMANAQGIVDAAKERSLGPEGAKIGVATGLVESGLRVLANPAVPASLAMPNEGLGYDHDSVGIFQQRQEGWGTLEQRMNPKASAGLFFNRLMSFDWRGMDPGAAAQRVQVSAFPAAYSGRMGEAAGIVDSLFDQGGVASGKGVMQKDILDPERVLSPEMTADFERLISVLERPDFVDVLRKITSDAVTSAASAASASSGASAPPPTVTGAAAASGPSTAFDPNNTGYDDTFYNDTVARGGKEGADAWLARQDFTPQIRTWGINAFKEIGGEFASPLGLEKRWGEAVDAGAKEYMLRQTYAENARKNREAGGGNTYITNEFHGYNGTPQQFIAEVERAARQGMTALTPV